MKPVGKLRNLENPKTSGRTRGTSREPGETSMILEEPGRINWNLVEPVRSHRIQEEPEETGRSKEDRQGTSPGKPTSSPWPMRPPLRASLALPKPNSLHTTLADSRSQWSSHTVPHSLFFNTSTRPSPGLAPPFSRTLCYGQGTPLEVGIDTILSISMPLSILLINPISYRLSSCS